MKQKVAKQGKMAKKVFDQQMSCTVHICWSKYTPHKVTYKKTIQLEKKENLKFVRIKSKNHSLW